MGNLNAVSDCRITKNHRKQQQLKYLKTLSLVDIWWHQNKTNRDYTFYSSRHKTYSHIDILVSEHFYGNISCAIIRIRAYSDHVPGSMIWEGSSGVPRLHRWKLNNFLLNCTGLFEKVVFKINRYFMCNIDSALEILARDTFKAYIHGILIAFKATKTKTIWLGLIWSHKFKI